MFNNPGSKLKSISIFVFIITIICGLAISIPMFSIEETIGAGVLILLLSPLIGWLSAIGLYAFGDLVNNTNETKEIQTEILEILQKGDKKQSTTINKTVTTKTEPIKPDKTNVVLLAKDIKMLEEKGCLVPSAKDPTKKVIPSKLNAEQLKILRDCGMMQDEVYQKLLDNLID